jgi:hypothetical protein
VEGLYRPVQTVSRGKGEDNKVYRKKVLFRKFDVAVSVFWSVTYLVDFSVVQLCGKQRVRGARFAIREGPQKVHIKLWMSVGSSFNSLFRLHPDLFHRLQQIANQPVELAVLLPQFLDLLDGMNNRGVMLSAKAAADLGQRRVRELLT